MARKKKKRRHNTMRKAEWAVGQSAGLQNTRSGSGERSYGPRAQERETFINPYNFVRLGQHTGGAERPQSLHTHECFHEGCFSGRLRCRLELITPLFIPEPEKRQPAPNGAKGETLRFNRGPDSVPGIPASSLKGMVRSIFEAVSGSCLSQINAERLDYREVDISRDLGPAVITEIDTNRKWATIALLDDTAWLPAYPRARDLRNGKQIGPGRPLFAYANIRKNRFIVKGKLKKDLTDVQKGKLEKIRKTCRGSISRGKFRAENLSQGDKDRLQPILRSLCKDNKIQLINYNVVTSPLRDDPAKLPPTGAGEARYQVLIKNTGQTISNKHDERVFFSETFKENLSENLGKLPNQRISFERIRDMNYVLREQFKRCARRKGEAAAARGLNMRLNRGGTGGLQEGDLVYYLNAGGKEHLALVLVPRLRYTRSPTDLLASHLRPCTSLTSLCAACRVFGMVGDGEKSAFKGKVFFSGGILDNALSPSISPSVRLKILGAPHATSTNFYLIGRNHDNTRSVTVKEGGYDKSGVMIRGRKFYWRQADEHRPLAPESYKRESSAEPTKFDKWVELMQPPAAFGFDVDFENLTREELGLLVWSLELEDDMHHSLGMGKPLGLGTIRVQIDNNRSFVVGHDGLRDYYGTVDKGIRDVASSPDVQGLKQEARTAIRGTGAYQDLKAILTYDSAIAAGVRYPSKMKKVSGRWQALGYAWFLDNRHQPLCTIEEISNRNQTQTGWEGGKP